MLESPGSTNTIVISESLPHNNDVESQKLLTIGIRGTGPGSGKDTAARIISALLTERGIRSSIQKFATPLRKQVEKETGIPVAVSETTEGKNIELKKFNITKPEHLKAILPVLMEENCGPVGVAGTEIMLGGLGITVGRYLQILGSLMKKETANPNYWIQQLFSDFDVNEVVIISDVRFPLEQKAVSDRSGITILIRSPNEIDPRDMAGRDVGHESERALDNTPPDYTIENNRYLVGLERSLERLIDSILVERTVPASERIRSAK